MTATSALTTPAVPVAFQSLVLNAAGEYTARSVASDPLDAAALHLVRQGDGNFAAPAPTPAPFVISGLAAGRSAFSVQSALYGLSLGG